MQRTIRLRLRPTAAQRTILLDTLAANTACFNTVAAYGWARQERNGVALHKATYYPLRAAHPTLPAQLVCSSRVRAGEALKSALTRQRQGRKTGCPTSRHVPIRYDARSYRLNPTGHLASLATTAGDNRCPSRCTLSRRPCSLKLRVSIAPICSIAKGTSGSTSC